MDDSSTTDILIVDDDLAIQRLISTLLRRVGYTCEAMADGAQALRRIESAAPRVLLLDLMMPKVNGFEVLAEIAERHPHLLARIIILTAASARVLEQIAPYRDKICRLIRKPFDIAELMVAIEECARGGISGTAETQRVDQP